MNCLDFQSEITRYINNELSFKEKESFIAHLKTCDNCRDELEIYYIVMTSLKQMDENKDVTSDYKSSFEKKIRSSERELVKRRYERLRRRITFPAVLSIVMLLTGLSVTDENEEAKDDAADKAKSIYEMKFRFAEDPSHITFEKSVDLDKILLELEKQRDGSK
jgi:hypothetical protein